jgi:hypothetical protein
LIADDATTWQRLTGGQYTEKREILDSLIGFLENLDEEGIAA